MTISTIDMHTGGEPLRIITGGLPEIPGKTVLERRRYFRDHLDHIRTGLMWEPRGHAVIALARYAVESGIVRKAGDVSEMVIDVPAGRKN